jgi:hypothetical protein
VVVTTTSDFLLILPSETLNCEHGGFYAPKGCRQRKCGNLAKSLSVVINSQPCSIAHAATQASLTNAPSIAPY